VNGNLLYSGCGTLDSLGGTINGTRTRDPHLDFPTLPTPPTTFQPGHTLGNITGGALILPRATDTPVTKNINGYQVQVYEYKVTSIDLNGNGKSITITPGKKVIFYLERDISTSGQGNITHNCTGYVSLGSLTPYSTTTVFPIPNSTNPLNEDCKTSNVQIYGYAKDGLTGTGAVDTDPSICLNGNGFLQALILGPTYKAGVAGAGTSGGFKGSVWVNEWSNGGNSCGSNTSNVVIEQTTTWGELVALGLIPKNLAPTLAPISAWQRQEASP
jgi:hypothetical protein